MSSNIVNGLYESYIEEVIKPQLGKQPESSSKSSDGGDAGGSGGDQSAKRIRQAVYDIRYRARREDIPLSTAFTQYMSHTSMNSVEKTQVREKLGLTPGGGGESKPTSESFDITEEEKQMVVVTPAKGFGKPYRRYATSSKIHKLRSNPQIQSVEKTKYGTPYEGERTKGSQTAAALQPKPKDKLAKKDYDGDGKLETGTDEWKGSRDKAIKKAIAKKPINKESYYSWRDELAHLFEGVDDELYSSNQKQIKEKKVNNQVKINPDVAIEQKESSPYIIESYELNEDTILEKVDIATEYFFEQGLNEHGVDILIEDLGLEEFVSFVFELSEEYTLTEAKFDRLPPVSKSGKKISSLKGGAKTSAIKSKRQIRATLRQKVEDESKSKPGFKSFSQKHTAVAKAKKEQPSNKPLKDRIAKGVLGAVKAYQQGMERHKAATKTAGKALKVAAKGASEFGKGVASGVKATGKVAKDVHRVLKNSYDMEEELHPSVKKIDDINAQRIKTRSASAQRERLDKATSASNFQNFKKKHIAGGGTQTSALDAWMKKKKNMNQQEATNPYAVGMAVAMKSTGDKPPLKKSTITKAHKIAKRVDVKESISSVTGQKGNNVTNTQQDTEQKQAKNAASKLNKILMAKKSLQTAQQNALRSGATDISLG